MTERIKFKAAFPELVGTVGRISLKDHSALQPKSIFRKRQFSKNIFTRLQTDGQFLRSIIQSFFVGLVLWIGIDFYRFVRFFETGGQTTWVNRPPGVESFLPISALISFKYWIQTGILNTVHPAGLFILLAVMTTSWFYQKAFCSWICPIGFISETLWMLGEKIFKRNWKFPVWLDWLLRSLKYLFLFFFVFAILQMDIESLRLFIYSPYNKVADIKMMNFFRHITVFALEVLFVLVVFSVFIKNFWCRYLCPYGALNGLIGLFSLSKITRNESSCIDCGKCARVCPSRIAVDRVSRVTSDECMACLACIDACPIPETLEIRTINLKRIPNWAFALAFVTTFAGMTGTAMLTGHWRNTISAEEYKRRIQNIHNPIYEHNRGKVPNYTEQD